MKSSFGLSRGSCLIRYARCETVLYALIPSLLFSWAPPTFAEDEPFILQRMLVEIDPAIMRDLIGSKPGDEVRFPWFDDSALAAVVRSVRENQNTLELLASVEHFAVGDVILTLGHGALVGTVTLDSSSFRIHRVESGLYAIDEIDVDYLMPRGPESDTFVDVDLFRRSGTGKITSYHAPGNTFNRIRQYTAEKAPDRQLRELLYRGKWRENGFTFIPDGDTVIDIMVAYTSEAADWVEGQGSIMDLEIHNMISKANNAFQFSGVRALLNLVHTTEVEYTVQDPSFEDDMDLLNSFNDGVLDHILVLRNQHKADLVNLLVRRFGDGASGYAWTPRPDSLPQPGEAFIYDPKFEKHGFSIVEIRSGVNALTFPHEVAHNLGAHHDSTTFDAQLAAGTTDPTFHDFARGWVVVEERVRTIMAYNNLCNDEALGTCKLLPFFSNPNLSFQGYPLGDPSPGTVALGPANNVEAMNQFVWFVANYRNSSSP